MEVWKNIDGYEGLYQVSNLGRVKSFNVGTRHDLGDERILKPVIVRKGYLSVNLCKAGKQKLSRISRIVATAFIPNQKNKPDINHKDGNRQNNRVDNLEWVTKSENTRHSFDVLKRKNSRWKGGINIFTKEGVFIKKVDDTKAAVKWIKKQGSRYKVCVEAISSACRGKSKTAYGYIFKYVRNEKTTS